VDQTDHDAMSEQCHDVSTIGIIAQFIANNARQDTTMLESLAKQCQDELNVILNAPLVLWEITTAHMDELQSFRDAIRGGLLDQVDKMSRDISKLLTAELADAANLLLTLTQSMCITIIRTCRHITHH